jgi:hypothetical protein
VGLRVGGAATVAAVILIVVGLIVLLGRVIVLVLSRGRRRADHVDLTFALFALLSHRLFVETRYHLLLRLLLRRLLYLVTLLRWLPI